MLEPGATVTHEIAEGRAAYVITTDGAIDAGGLTVDAGERLVARGPRALVLRAIEATQVVLVDVSV